MLVIDAGKLDDFAAIARRERCPYAVIGEINDTGVLVLEDRQRGTRPVDLPLEVLLGKAPKMLRDVRSLTPPQAPLSLADIDLREAAYRLLRFPAVADKTFLISIGDRTVGGMISRDQMVGPWQVPVADVAVTIADYFGHARRSHGHGRAHAGGGARCARLGAPGGGRGAHQHPGGRHRRRSRTFGCRQTGWRPAANPVRTPRCTPRCTPWARSCVPALGIAIPVGKDSLSMKTVWGEGAARKSVVAPVSLIVSAFAPVGDVRKTWTPQLRTDLGATTLVAGRSGRGQEPAGRIVAGAGARRSSARRRPISTMPDTADEVSRPRSRSCVRRTWCWPTTIAPTAACSPRWSKWPSPAIAGSTSNYRPAPMAPCGALFSEELGVVLQVQAASVDAVEAILARHGLGELTHAHRRAHARDARAHRSGRPAASTRPGKTCAAPGPRPRSACASCAMSPVARARSSPPPAIPARPASTSRSPSIRTRTSPRRSSRRARPKVAVLREQGVNSQVEMAAVLERAGFESHDVHMSDVLSGRVPLRRFRRSGGLRRFLLRRRAGRGRGLGQVHPVSRAHPR